MTLNQFNIFCAVAEEKSFSKAAKRLHLTQPAISGQVKALENTYNLCLFQRTPSGVNLTEAGNIVYQYAKQIHHILEGMEDSLAILAKNQPCRLVVGASTVVGSYPLPCTIWVFKEHQPQANIQLEVENSSVILQKIKSASLDFAIIEGSVDDEDIVQLNCLTDEMALVVPNVEPWIYRGNITLDELLTLPLIIREEGSGIRSVIENELKKQGVSISNLNVFTEMSKLQSIKSAIEAGHGLSILPKLTVRKELYTKTLKALPVQGLNFELTCKIIYHKNKFLTDIAKDFIRLITDPEQRAFC